MRAVEDVRQKRCTWCCGTWRAVCPNGADLVSDPVQAGVVGVIAVADTATFDIVRTAEAAVRGI